MCSLHRKQQLFLVVLCDVRLVKEGRGQNGERSPPPGAPWSWWPAARWGRCTPECFPPRSGSRSCGWRRSEPDTSWPPGPSGHPEEEAEDAWGPTAARRHPAVVEGEKVADWWRVLVWQLKVFAGFCNGFRLSLCNKNTFWGVCTVHLVHHYKTPIHNEILHTADLWGQHMSHYILSLEKWNKHHWAHRHSSDTQRTVTCAWNYFVLVSHLGFIKYVCMKRRREKKHSKNSLTIPTMDRQTLH